MSSSESLLFDSADGDLGSWRYFYFKRVFIWASSTACRVAWGCCLSSSPIFFIYSPLLAGFHSRGFIFPILLGGVFPGFCSLSSFYFLLACSRLYPVAALHPTSPLRRFFACYIGWPQSISTSVPLASCPSLSLYPFTQSSLWAR